MGTEEVVQTLGHSTALAETVLLRVEELELLISNDCPRRLIELAQAELADAVGAAANFWATQEEGLAAEASTSADGDVQYAWREFRSLLVRSARRAAEASSVIAMRVAVTEDALSALGLYKEYGRSGAVRTGELPTKAPVRV